MALCLLSIFVPVGTVIPQRKKPSPEKTPETTVSRGTTLVAGRKLPTSLARNAGAAIPPTALQRDISRTRFPEPVAAALALCCGSLMDHAGVFFRSSILCSVLYHGKTPLSKVFLPRPAISEGYPRKGEAELERNDRFHKAFPGERRDGGEITTAVPGHVPEPGLHGVCRAGGHDRAC